MSTRVTLLGSTGSIGTQGLQVIEAHPERFAVEVLAGGANTQLLAEQAARHRPSLVAAAAGTREDLTAAIATTWQMLRALDLPTRVPGGGALLSGAY